MTTEILDARRFRALQQDWTSEDLARFFLLTPEDVQEVRTCRGAANRLGFALNLLLLRLLHCPLPDVTLTPARIVQFVAMQLNVHPDVLAEYSARRPQTGDEHLVQIRSYLKLRPYAHERDDPRLTDYLLTRALQRDDPAVLLEEAEEWLREEGILFPAESTIHKIIAQVRPQAESQVFAAITQQLSATQAQAWKSCCTASRAGVVRPSRGSASTFASITGSGAWMPSGWIGFWSRLDVPPPRELQARWTRWNRH